MRPRPMIGEQPENNTDARGPPSMLARTLLCACAATASALARPGLFAMRGRHAPRMVLDLAKTAQPGDSG